MYGERLRLLQRAIESRFGSAIEFPDGDAGLHLTLHLPAGCDDTAISRQARAAGIIARSLSTYYLQPRLARPGLILGYACVPHAQIGPAFDKLADIIRRHWPT